jgi:hypothetical protein
MAEARTYDGSCHCGQVRYRVTTDLGQVISCNCSICGRTGALLNFVPVEQFELLSGEDKLRDYQFNKHVVHHLFCENCGVRSFAKGVGPGGKEMRAINVRCLEGVDLDALSLTKYDGKSR